jgi:cellulose synthase/poly-beta-1,6-N-acetylglucosamine synthase-like glycosyltransferase
MMERFATISFEIAVYVFLVYIFLSVFLGLLFSFRKRQKSEKFEKVDMSRLFYYIIIPAFDEELVIQETLRRLSMHPFNGKIVVMDDDSSDDTYTMSKNMIKEDNRIFVIKRSKPRAHIGKGDSLNQAMDYIQADCRLHSRNLSDVVIGVLDADGSVSKNAFNTLNAFFSNNNNVICQLRVKMQSPFKNSLQVAQDLEFFSVNNLSQKMRMYTNTVGLSGNGQFFRLKSIVSSIGWHPWGNALLDDYEMTLKLMLHNIVVRYIDTAYVYQQALTNPHKLMRQRSRWVQGNLDCLKYLRSVVKSARVKKTQKIGVLYFLIQPWLNLIADISVFYLFSISISRYVNVVLEDPSLLLNIVIMISVLFIYSIFWGIFFEAFYVQDLYQYNEARPQAKQLIALPIISSYLYVLLFGSLVMAFWRQISGNSVWIKTSRKID